MRALEDCGEYVLPPFSEFTFIRGSPESFRYVSGRG
jgi:hypothetical protein